ncbi:SPOR domain-containing protein [Rubellimicrobium rubrum]|uniref:SPOR domain-containing protein n=1 Tax=Rubellimicrobium rubrum TaxID=2585369 RepID=A0A5C4N7U8_9RHOB|nr:SPOR domain-containing protein [Rubellimicrobium rubrum]TNC52750.1 SPOR domain-containing protein [Rubellimicrobium rubrum]
MADWTANSSFGGLSATRGEARAPRDKAPRAAGPRAERFGPDLPGETPRSGPYAALAAYNAGQGGPLAKARLAGWVAGGVVSLALVGGIGVWGYKLVLREVLGLPVVAAEEGPMRVLPTDPGGEVVPSQGLAVNAVPAAGIAAPPSDVLMLAPPTPGLSEEDLEVVQTTAEADEMVARDVAPVAPAPSATPVTTIVPSDRPMTSDEVLAFADQISAGVPAMTTDSPTEAAPVQGPEQAPEVVPGAEAATVQASVQAGVIAPPVRDAAPEATVILAPPADAAADAAPEAAPVLTVIPAEVPGVAAALRPALRPARASAPAPEAVEAPATEAVAAVAPEGAVATGTHMIQLGAYDSAEIAASEWVRLQGEFGAFLGPKERVIQEAQTGGRTFFRLRATGFADHADARRLCAALTAEDADCIPVVAD